MLHQWLRVASHLWQSFRRAGLDSGATIRRLRIRCEFVPDAGLRVGLGAADEKIVRREMQALRDRG